ncbi:hypothetical protein QTI66_17740 [Variovorax sp. J22R133]|uniref:hypothetical protein n=1 Tax=Variovorax brevis TaxID=3053503 RepID=UPI0025788994|nr:hypothetical protein [Variovorax sp. J22R133]MDM0114001.1 hypothetical protein [Variovorax sp. J22R133]
MKTDLEPAGKRTPVVAGVRVNLRRTWRSMAVVLFEKDGLNTFFQHARNVLTGAAIVGAGLYAINHVGVSPLRGMWAIHTAGYAIAALGALLLGLNLFDGLRRLTRLRQPRFLKFSAVLLYVALSIRLTQVILYLRTPL